MGSFLITTFLYSMFAAAFWGGLRFVPGRIGRRSFFFGVQAVTLVGWMVIADTATVPSMDVALGVGVVTAFVTGFLTGALSGAFARYLNRSPHFAWAALVPFALPVMALMSENVTGHAARDARRFGATA